MELNYDLIQKGMLGCIDSPGYITDATYDINNLQTGESCYYDASITPVNAPTSGCRIYCIEGYGRPHQAAKFQIAVKYNQLKPYIRHYWNGTWSSWEQIALKGETLSDIKGQINSSKYKTNTGSLNFNTVTTQRFLTGSGRGCALVGYAGAEGAWALYLLTWNDYLASFATKEITKVGTFMTTPSFTTYIDSTTNTYGIDMTGRRYSNAFVILTATTFTYNNIASTS